MIENASAAASAARDLSTWISSDRLLTSGSAYDQSLRIWNGAVDHRPALIVRCEKPTEVQAAVLAARRRELPLSMRGGGHDWVGRALRHSGLVIDLSRMRRVRVDWDGGIATIGGGATVGDVIATAAPYGLSAATGTVSSVGMAGLTLGGGYGPLNGRFGLALDNLFDAEVILADGRIVTADASQEPELYWALRSGGGNFGVVTSMRIRLHRLQHVLAGFILYPWSQAADVLSGFDAVVANALDELTIQSGVVSAPDGSSALLLSPTWSGPLAQGENAINQLRELGSPLVSQVMPTTYADALRLWDPYVVNGRHYAIRTRSVAADTPDVVSAFVEAGSTRSSPLAAISVHHFHGAAARIPVETTAFGTRRDHFMVEIAAAWEPDDSGASRHRAWADTVSDTLAPMALPGGYANLLGPGDDRQISHAYGKNAARLRGAKTRFDLDGVFSAIPIPFDQNHSVGR